MKRALLILLALTMIVSMTAIAPLGVYAEEELEIGAVAADYAPEGTAINSAADFAAMTADGKYYLAADITVDATWAGSFTGTFDGNGKTVTTTVAPLFEEFNGTLLNLTVEGDVEVTTGGYSNALSATADPINSIGVIANAGATTNDITVTNVANKVNLSGSGNKCRVTLAGFIGVLNNYSENVSVFTSCANYGNITGGIIFDANADCSAFVSRVLVDTTSEDPYVTFDSCVNYGTMNATGRVGAFVAMSRGGIKLVNCVNNGDLQAINGYVGGLVGRLGDSAGVSHISVFENCVNNATITSYYAQGGGILGFADMADKLTFKNCVNNGNVDFSNASANNSNLGGIVGAFEPARSDEVIFDGCINNGDIGVNTTTTYSLNVGGIVGWAREPKVMQTYVNCVNNGEIRSTTASSFVGGIAGRLNAVANSKGYKFDGCINNGDITSGYNAGGIMGTDAATIVVENCQFIRCGNTGDVTANTYAGGIAGRATRAFAIAKPVITFLYCYNTGNIHSDTNYAGGIMGGRDNFQAGWIQYCFVAGSVTSDKAIDAIAIANGGTVAREKIYSYTGTTGTRYFYGPQAGKVTIEGDKVTWISNASSTYQSKGTVTSGSIATVAGVHKITVGGKDYALNLAVGNKVEVVDATLPIITVDGIKVDAVEYVLNTTNSVKVVLDTYAADDFAPWAFALYANFVGNAYMADNYVLDSIKAPDVAQGAFGTAFATTSSCATRVTADDLADGTVAYAINQAAGEDIFFQNLDPELFEVDAFPTIDNTHGKIVEVGGKLVNPTFDIENNSGSPATGDATIYVVVALAVSTVALAGFTVAKKVKEN